MIQSASILPLIEEFAWGRSIAPGPLLTQVEPQIAVDVVSYRKRDQELAYRDLVVASLLTEVVIKVGDVWHFRARRPQLPATVVGTLAYDLNDAPAGGAQSPGSVDHVVNSSVPVDAIDADKGLYARDVILQEALRRAASVLTDNPIPALATIAPSDAWSIAEGTVRTLASVGYNLPLNVALFKDPDTDLAARDNQLAVFIAQLQEIVANIFARARRLLVRAPGQEPDTYVLTEETDAFRIWSAFPLLPDGRLQLRYDKMQQTVSWLGEQALSAGPAPQASTFPVANGQVDVLGQLPIANDAEFFRQKAARLYTRPYTDRIIFQTSFPELYLTSGGIYQTDSVLAAVPGQLLFSLPIIIPSGCARIGLQILPSRFIKILGFLNRNRSADGTAVTIPPLGSTTFDIPLPVGRIRVQLDLTDKTARTSAFDLEITANGNLIFEGAFTFNQAPGTNVTTQPFELDNSDALTPGIVTIVVTRLRGAGNLTINQITFTTPTPDPDLSYTLSLQLGANQATAPVQLKGVAERQDVVWFDTLVLAPLADPVLGISYNGGNNAALYINSYDIRVFDLRAALPNAAAYEPHKVALAVRALESVQRAWRAALVTTPQDPSSLDVDGNRIWDSGANFRWLSILEAKQPRLLLAFDVAGPGDIGRPALIPDGLVLDEVTQGVKVTYPTPRLNPVFRTLQAWMLEFGPRVAGPDFWPQSEAGCASIGDLAAIIVKADFDWAFTEPFDTSGYLTSISSITHTDGGPDGTSFTAYTIANDGPGGGTIQQTVVLTIGLARLNVGASYDLKLSLIRQPVGGGTQTPYTVIIPVNATGATMTIELPPIVASLGYSADVQSVVLESGP